MNILKNIFRSSVILSVLFFSLRVAALVPSVANAATCPVLQAGDLFKVSGSSAVYLLNSDLQRLYFPNGDVYKTWYVDYSGVQEIPNTCVDNYPAPSAPPYGVNYRPGSKLVKVQISPSVYVVETGNKISKIGSESVARELYGTNWASKVADIADVFWPNYVARGTELTEAVPHNGMLIKVVGTNAVYFIKDEKRYLVEGSPRGDVQTVSQAVFDRVPDSYESITANSIYSEPTQVSTTPVIVPPELDKPTDDLISPANVRITTASGASITPSIAWTGTNYGMVWSDSRDNSKSEIYFALLDENGNRIGMERRLTNTPTLVSANPEIVYGNNQFAVVYSEYDDVLAVNGKVNFLRLDSSGTVLGSVVTLIDIVTATVPKISSDGSGYAVIWRTPNNSSAKTYFSYLDSNGNILTNQVRIVSVETSDQTEIIWDGSMFGIIYRQSERKIVYGEARGYTVGTYLYRVDKSANAEKEVVFVGSKEALTATWNGTNYAVVEDGKTFSTFGTNGNNIISNKEFLQTGLGDPDLIYDHTKYGVVGQRDSLVNFTELNSDGTVAQSVFALNDTMNSASSTPRIMWSGKNYGVVWSDTKDNNTGGEIYFRKLDSK